MMSGGADRRIGWRLLLAGAMGLCTLDGAGARTCLAGPFAAFVVGHDPAPGQFVNVEAFNDPQAALGAPRGGGTNAADNTSIVSLGAFGGSITLGFDHTVEDDPLNPFGLDAIVFGNAFWSGGHPEDHWAECATIEISRDVNGNGVADDPWYLIPGSHLPDPGERFETVIWDDEVADATYPPALASWIPNGTAGTWSTAGWALPAEIFGTPVVRNPEGEAGVEGIYGYAEYAPTLLLGDFDADNFVDDVSVTPETFYTVPDDPLTVGMTPGSGGGDAFDIAWAVDPVTAIPAGLLGFDFIRIASAVNVSAGLLGEVSAEIDAVADVAPDPFGDVDEDGDIDLADLAELQVCFDVLDVAAAGCGRVDREPDDVVDLQDAAVVLERLAGPR